MGQTMELRLRQHLTLTPQLQQALRLLQLSSLEFEQEMREALDTNPFLEEEDDGAGRVAGRIGRRYVVAEPAPEPIEVDAVRIGQPRRTGRSAAERRERRTATRPTGPNGPRRSLRWRITCAASSCCRRWASATARSLTS